VADEDRPQYQHGLGTIGGQTFHWGSGTPGKYWSIPYGDYPVTPDAPTGDWAHQAGAIPVANNVIPDPVLHRNRIGIMIHSGSAPDLDTLYTQGCFKVAPSEWPAVRQEILAEAKNAPLYLHVAPGGVASFSNTKTPTQASDETPAANANAAANTTGAKPVSGVDIRDSVYQMLVGKGLTANQAMGVVYSMMGESGTGLDASSLGDNGKSIGFGQWNGDRRANLEAIAKSMNVAPTDPSAQLAHFKTEIDGPYAAEVENVKKNASSAADATRLWTGSVGEKSGYERPETNNWQQRFATGAQAGKIGDDGSPVWTTPSTNTPAPSTTTPSTTTPGPPTSIGDAIAKLTKDDAKGASPLDKLGQAFAPKEAQTRMGSEPMLQAPQDNSMMLSGPAQQLMATNIASMKPLSWSTSPYGSGLAGPQAVDPSAMSAAAGQFGIRPPGLTLNSLSPFGYG